MGRGKKANTDDQAVIPDLAQPRNDKVHRAAIRYAKERNKRIDANAEEKSAHDTLVRLMQEAGLQSYTYKDVEVHIDTTNKAKVKVGGESENGKPEANGEE